MFWDKIIPEKFLVKSEICGLEVNIGEEGTYYYFTCLKQKGKKLEIQYSGHSEGMLEIPAQIKKNKVALVPVVNGKGMIVKKVFLGEGDAGDFEDIISQNFPAIQRNEFYIQLYRQKGGASFIAVCRKELADRILEELKATKLDVAGIYLGIPAVIGMQPVWDNFNTVSGSNFTGQLSNNALDEISPQVEGKAELKIDDLQFSKEYTLSFSAGLAYLMRRRMTESKDPLINDISAKHIEKNKFRFLLGLCVSLAFLLTVVNVIFYTSYFDRSNKLEAELSLYQGKNDQINKLLNDYQKKKDLIENAGVLGKNRLSEFADKIAATIPGDVLLTEMYFNPKIDKDENEDSLVTFKNRELIIRGNCNKSLSINEWINVLKMQKFIKDVSLEKFAYKNDAVLPNYEIKVLTE